MKVVGHLRLNKNQTESKTYDMIINALPSVVQTHDEEVQILVEN